MSADHGPLEARALGLIPDTRVIHRGRVESDTPSVDYSPVTLPDRIRSKIHVAESGCWEWMGALDRAGYGHAWSPSLTRSVGAHREVYRKLVGEIPAGLVLDHLCSVRHCVNPAHLEPVTTTENIRRGRNHNREKTHCPQGHPYSGDNLYEAVGSRMCRTCIRENNRREAERWRAATARRSAS